MTQMRRDTRRRPQALLLVILMVLLIAGWLISENHHERTQYESEGDPPSHPEVEEANMTERITRSEEEWRKQLSPEAYQVCRQKGTERAFTGQYWDTKTPGTYVCTCCAQPLYDAKAKFDSGTGWPSFWQAVSPQAVDTATDSSHGMIRSELTCSRCGSHLGHVFDDGPPPTGQRHCINSISLRLIPSATEEIKP